MILADFAIAGYSTAGMLFFAVGDQVLVVHERLLKAGGKFECPEHGFSLRVNSRGYWCSARIKGNFYRRCASGRIIGSRPQDIHEQIARFCRLLLKGQGISEAGRALLHQCALYTLQDYQALEQVFHRTYPEGVPVLPPDRYQDLVIPLTAGCPNGHCTFCAFYKDKPFVLLDGHELEQRVDGVLALFPDGFSGRDGLFLGSANALAIPVSRLQAQLTVLNAGLGRAARGISCFGDADHCARRSVDQWGELKELGLQQVVLGLETGDTVLRARLGKSGCLVKTKQLVHDLKQAGIDVGLTLLTGVESSDHLCKQQFTKTFDFVSDLPLNNRDRIYISPWFTTGKPSALAEKQAQQLRELLVGQTPARISHYSSHNFQYYL